MALLVNGLTEKHKAFLYDYAQQKLGSKSRTQAILSLINEKMSEYETSQKSLLKQLNLIPIKEKIAIFIKRKSF
jgi:hypothetical protein